ncbi:hypothetical protein EV191_12725 [Tamaricihabitans halophyticus]|uniref:Uncharacterized protein n=1 Tax=Tamaricihabitans halophyticus TaxID=1262583 RepID=A0A4R2PYG4_9PSEU|nr:hypothetical protein [Tamaricihabitans halophyticus]TCP41127.1 hypothetical protein EV191_12725 [Tamaricihabitans halophyticus]
MTTVIIIVVLVVIAAGALALIPLMNASTRQARLAPEEPSGPLPGSPAQVWLARGERVLGELRGKLSEAPVFDMLSADAEQVVGELRATAGQVAELDRGIAQIPTPELERQRDHLAEQLSARQTAEASPEGLTEQYELTKARESVESRLAVAERQRAARDALLTRMESAVLGLESSRDEVTVMLVESAGAELPAAATAQAALSERLTGLRAGLTEVRELTAGDMVRPDTDPPPVDRSSG